MRWSPLLSVVIGLSIATGRLLSQETPVDDSSGSRGSPLVSLLRDGQAAHFQLVLGRIELDRVRYRKGSFSRQSVAHAAGAPVFSEMLSIDSDRGIPRLHYSRQTALHRLILDINERGRLLIESEINGNRLSLVQERGRPLVVRRYQRDRYDESNFATWVHLYATIPAIYKQHLQPLVDDLIHPVRLSELADRAHARSVTDLTVPAAIDNLTLNRYIALLGSTQRSQRIEAQRELHQCGIAVLPRLRAIDPSTLDAEQRQRLGQVVRQLTPPDADCESRVATLIRDDSTYWAATANRLSGQEQILIAARLAELNAPPPHRTPGAAPAVRVAAVAPPDSESRR